jgi:hypothetical protein
VFVVRAYGVNSSEESMAVLSSCIAVFGGGGARATPIHVIRDQWVQGLTSLLLGGCAGV